MQFATKKTEKLIHFSVFMYYVVTDLPKSVSTHSPSLRPPFRVRMPNFFSFAKSLSIVLSTLRFFSDIFSDMAFAEILELRDNIFSITI